MFCEQCGAEILEGKKFCVKCGAKIDETTNEEEVVNEVIEEESTDEQEKDQNSSVEIKNDEERPKTKKELKEEKKAKKKTDRKNWSLAKKIRRFIIKSILTIILLLVLLIGGAVALTSLGIVPISAIEKCLDTMGLLVDDETETEDSFDEEKYKIEPIDADDYFGKNSKAVESFNASESQNVQSESEVTDFLKERGFDQYPIETTYTMNGEYIGTLEISKDSAEKHPMYSTYYVNKKEEVWQILVIDGEITADPISYNMQEGRKVAVTFSESEKIVSYDNVQNKFYYTIPKDSAMEVKVVEKIDAGVLESLTIEEIDRL